MFMFWVLTHTEGIESVTRRRYCAGSESIPCSAAELVRRRELSTLARGLGTEQVTGGGRPYQPRHQLRPSARHRLLDGDAAAPQALFAGTVQRWRQRCRYELRRQTTSYLRHWTGSCSSWQHWSRQLQWTERHCRHTAYRWVYRPILQLYLYLVFSLSLFSGWFFVVHFKQTVLKAFQWRVSGRYCQVGVINDACTGDRACLSQSAALFQLSCLPLSSLP